MGVIGAIGLTLGAGAPASAAPYAPANGQVYAGVSDSGYLRDYRAYSKLVGAHLPVLQSFEVWDGELEAARDRWRALETRGMLSISTAPCYQCEGVISPGEIARGKGDDYLLRLNAFLAEWGKPTYLRLFPEMNGHWNPYAAFNSDGSGRGADNRTGKFRKAWRRFALIVRGGETATIDARLKRLGLPPVRRGGEIGVSLPEPKLALMWVPQTHGSPQTHANRPGAYWPGRRYVDWVGADIYAKFPNFEGLSRFYRSRKKMAFVIGEWATWDRDDPGFVDTLHNWIEKRGRAKMVVYYQGFDTDNPFSLQRYPLSAARLADRLNARRYREYAPGTKLGEGREPAAAATARSASSSPPVPLTQPW